MKKQTEFENFDKIMSGLLAVPYSELHNKLEKEKRDKAKKKKPLLPAFPPPVRSSLFSATYPLRQRLFLLLLCR